LTKDLPTLINCKGLAILVSFPTAYVTFFVQRELVIEIFSLVLIFVAMSFALGLENSRGPIKVNGPTTHCGGYSMSARHFRIALISHRSWDFPAAATMPEQFQL